jgi:EF-P beta-lysylation protein EpmB
MWQTVLKGAVRDPVELCRRLGLPAEFEGPARAAARGFGVFVPAPYLARIRPGDPCDPLLRQVLPLADELVSPPEFVSDPVGDRDAAIAPGLIKKYEGRALWILTGACPVHCRYCFRRHFAYDEAPKGFPAWEENLAQVAADETIGEVILSGGDPLMLVDSQLAELARRLAAIRHVRRLRIHTRMPIMAPQRVCDELLAWLCGTRLTPVVVIHANHPREIDADVAEAIGRLVDAGVPVLNQSVLLAGVNDSADVLVELCERLVDLRVVPYYLHQLDRVIGAAHFEVQESVGLAIMADLRRRLPGYAVPRYVRETPGAASKVVLA